MSAADVEKFRKAVDSTVMKLCYQDAAELLGVIDVTSIEDISSSDQITKSGNDAVLFEKPILQQDPRDPLWSVRFAVGVKTVSDFHLFRLNEHITKLASLFPEDGDIVIANYVPELGMPGHGEVMGSLYLTSVSMDDAAGEMLNTFQLLRIEGKAIRT